MKQAYGLLFKFILRNHLLPTSTKIKSLFCTMKRLNQRQTTQTERFDAPTLIIPQIEPVTSGEMAERSKAPD